jgi:hypothetical protein
MAPNLVGLKGIYWGRTVPLVGAELTIGREQGNTLVCDGDSKVSRRHARITGSSATYSLEDLGSANGTFVNGARINMATLLKSGDEIRIGDQTYRFESGVDVPPAYAPPTGPIPIQRPREISRGEQSRSGWGRGTERIYDGPKGPIGDGCVMPRLNLPDLSGCLRILTLLLIALVAMMIIGGILYAIGMAIGAMGGALGGGGSHGGGSSAPQGGGSSQTGGSGGGPPPPEAKPGKAIRIKSVQVVSTRDGQRIIVSWENLTDDVVHKIWARVTVLDSQGNLSATVENVVIYDGPPVGAGASHQDDPAAKQGFKPPIPEGTSAGGASVEPTFVE